MSQGRRIVTRYTALGLVQNYGDTEFVDERGDVDLRLDATECCFTARGLGAGPYDGHEVLNSLDILFRTMPYINKCMLSDTPEVQRRKCPNDFHKLLSLCGRGGSTQQTCTTTLGGRAEGAKPVVESSGLVSFLPHNDRTYAHRDSLTDCCNRPEGSEYFYRQLGSEHVRRYLRSDSLW